MARGIEDLYWANVEQANNLHKVVNPLDYLIEKESRKELMDSLLKLSRDELDAVMSVAYEDTSVLSASKNTNSGIRKFENTYSRGLKRVYRNLRMNHEWDVYSQNWGI